MRKPEDYISVLARTISMRVTPHSTPSSIFEDIDLVIRKGIDEYKKRSAQPDRLLQQWQRGFFTGIASTLISVVVGAFIGAVILS